MSTQAGTNFADYEQRQAEVANRLWKAREHLGLTQLEFAAQVAITRDRLASYEDGRTPLRCDIALRLCRQFFISEFWLAYGAVNEEKLKAKEVAAFSELDARLTMALAVEPIALSCPPGVSFVEGFEPYLSQEYVKLASAQNGFPRIKALPSDGPDYFSNALHCVVEFWKRGLTSEQWLSFFYLLVVTGQSLHGQVLRPDDPLHVDMASITPEAFAKIRKIHPAEQKKKPEK